MIRWFLETFWGVYPERLREAVRVTVAEVAAVRAAAEDTERAVRRD